MNFRQIHIPSPPAIILAVLAAAAAQDRMTARRLKAEKRA